MPNAHRFDQDNGYKSFQLPGAKPHYTPDRPVQLQHIALDLAFDLERHSCQGICTLTLRPIRDGLQRLTLDAVNQQIQAVTVAGQPQQFDYDGVHLQVYLSPPSSVDQPLQLAITYRLEQPQRGLYFIAPDPDYPTKPVQVWTQGEDEDSRYWFPGLDYPGQLVTSEMRLRVPQPYQAIANGDLVSQETLAADTIYHWHQRQVHPPYLLALAVGDFDCLEDRWQEIPLTYYVEKGRSHQAQLTMGKTPRMMAFLSDRYGYPYPFSKYAQVCAADFIFGGMENTSMTILTDRCLLDDRAALDHRNSEMLVLHELAHQWFGDLLVINHWSHAWVKEGMATYAEILWTEAEYGADEAAYYRLGEARSYLEEDKSRYRRPMVTHIYREAIELYDCHIYEKGAWIYHMTRAVLGEELFWKAIRHFVQTHAHQTVETIDLLRAIDHTTGHNLRPLFDQYVLRGGHPDYRVAYHWDGESHLAKLTVTQTQAKADHPSDLFDLRLPLAFGYLETVDNGEPQVRWRSLTLHLHEHQQALYFPLEQKPDFISFDQGNHHLKTVTLEYPLPELKAQLRYDPDPLSRIEAAIALAKQGSLEAVQALATALQQDPFWGVRAEVAKQLARVPLDQVQPILIQGLTDPEPRVRRLVAQALGEVKTQASYKALKALVKQGDPSYQVEAAAIAALGQVAAADWAGEARQGKTLQRLAAVLAGPSGWNEVVRCGAIAALKSFKSSPQALDLLLRHTVAGIPQPLRLAAIRALGPISTGQSQGHQDRILERLGAIAREPFFLTQMAVVAALEAMVNAQALTLLQSLADQTRDGRVRRRAEEAIQTVQGAIGKDPSLETLRQTLEELKQTHQEMKSRLADLEARAVDRTGPAPEA
jgi:aminopeptidase N